MPHRAQHVPHVESGTYPRRKGCAVMPLVDGEPAFRRICEAVETARTSVWVTVAFLEPDFEMPDGRGHFFDVLDRAAERGLDVRALFWRSPEVDERAHFPGSERQRALLRERGARFAARWDSLPGDTCHHQKSWLVDAGEESEVAFVGGINLDKGSVSPPGHGVPGSHHVHDVYLELRGPAATDVHHNFAQRWNEASEHARSDGHWPEGADAGPLVFPDMLSPEAGDVPVQITRTVQGGLYGDGTPSPDGKPFSIREGEFSIYDQYIAAIDAARRTIYLEDQAIGSPKVVGHLRAALERGVHVIFLVPGQCHPVYHEARKVEATRPFFDLVASLDHFPGFSLVAIATNRGEGEYGEVYVHAKIMLVDDAWATIGSTNVADRSFRQDTELNASIWHGDVTQRLRQQLFAEHLGFDTSGSDDLGAFRSFHDHARANAWRRLAGEPLQGLAYRLDAGLYGLAPPIRFG
jgi:phosphatidylserine/phosphatidylglycerophosphate/cardiolipin synthase-like enzyme